VFRSSFKILQYITLEELTRFNDVLSLVLLIDHIGTIERKNLLKELPPDYLERIALKIPENLNKLLGRISSFRG
jgi:hypothetical protein